MYFVLKESLIDKGVLNIYSFYENGNRLMKTLHFDPTQSFHWALLVDLSCLQELRLPVSEQA